MTSTQRTFNALSALLQISCISSIGISDLSDRPDYFLTLPLLWCRYLFVHRLVPSFPVTILYHTFSRFAICGLHKVYKKVLLKAQKVVIFVKNLFTNQKSCAIMKMLWCPCPGTRKTHSIYDRGGTAVRAISGGGCRFLFQILKNAEVTYAISGRIEKNKTFV